METTVLYNVILKSTGERFQAYLDKTGGYTSPKYPGVVFKEDEITILGQA